MKNITGRRCSSSRGSRRHRRAGVEARIALHAKQRRQAAEGVAGEPDIFQIDLAREAPFRIGCVELGHGVDQKRHIGKRSPGPWRVGAVLTVGARRPRRPAAR